MFRCLITLSTTAATTHSSHSTARMTPKSCIGRLAACRTMIIKIPAPGTPAASTEAAIATTLWRKIVNADLRRIFCTFKGLVKDIINY